ncbi:MAG TPA: hypothetical protein VHH14_03550 [Solirubrobacterales bacterium]|nr:hypothetical protein [Solirubrobacterales bacterium]
MEDKKFLCDDPRAPMQAKQERLREQRRRSEREFAEMDEILREIEFFNRQAEDLLRRQGLL